MKRITLRIPDTPQGETIQEWLDNLPWGARNRAIVDALYAAATGQRQQAAPQPAQVDLAAIRRVVDAAVRTALNGVNIQAPSADQEDIIRETVDDVLADFDPDAIL